MTQRRRRSFVLLAVMAIVGSSLLIVTGLAYHAQADRVSSVVSAESAQAASLIWSGAQIVMRELDAQRDAILEGRPAQLDGQYVIFEQTGRLGVVRLIEIGQAGGLVVAEAGRIDVNTADSEMLQATGLVDPALAEAIVVHREQTLGRPYQSVAELLHVEGMTPEILYGNLTDPATKSGLRTSEDGNLMAGPGAGAGAALADIVTVFSVEPMLQRDGSKRMAIDTPWSDELARQIELQFDRETADAISQLMQASKRPASTSELIRSLRVSAVPLKLWPAIMDAIAPSAEEFRFGLIDLNTAPYEALLALEAMSDGAGGRAGQLEQIREGLTSEQRATPLWPVLTDIMQPEEFESIADHVTNRCWTYRVRLQAALVAADDTDGPDRPPVHLDRGLTVEIVIDLAGPRARIAYWRDVSMLPTAMLLAAATNPPPGAVEPVDEDKAISDETPAPAQYRDRASPSEGPPESDSRRDAELMDIANEDDSAPSVSQPPPVTKHQSGTRIGRWIAG